MFNSHSINKNIVLFVDQGPLLELSINHLKKPNAQKCPHNIKNFRCIRRKLITLTLDFTNVRMAFALKKGTQ